MDGPDPPALVAAESLCLEGAEHHAAIGQGDGMQGGAEVERSGVLDIASVVVHDEELQGGLGLLTHSAEAIAIAHEDNPPTGDRAGGEIVHPPRV